MYTPLARTIISGLLCSTIFLVVVVPLFYSYFDDMRQWFMGTIQRVMTTDAKRADSQSR